MSEYTDPIPDDSSSYSGGEESLSRTGSSSRKQKSCALPHPPEEHLDSPTPLDDVAHVQEIVWAGLFPPPALLREFEAAVPGSADRILRMAEAQHQLSLDSERKRLPANLRTHAVGQIFGGCIALGALIVAALAIWKGAPWPVPAIALAAVAAGPVPLLVQRLLGVVLKNKEESAE